MSSKKAPAGLFEFKLPALFPNQCSEQNSWAPHPQTNFSCSTWILKPSFHLSL